MKKIINKVFTKEFITYGICGAITTILNIVLYWALLNSGIDYKISNIIVLVVVKTVAYILSKIFVFKSKTENIIELFKEMARFIISRGFTMLVDYFGLIFMVEVLRLDNFYSKIFLAILVIILNYILGKKAVFKTDLKK